MGYKSENPVKHKIYLFLTNEIGSVGGGQLYLLQKGNALIEAGFTPMAAYFLESPLMVSALRELRSRYVREMEYPWGALTESYRERGLRKLLSLLYDNSGYMGKEGKEEEVVIESYSAETSLWGEALLEALRKRGVSAFHLCYLLTENPEIRTPYQRALLERKLIAGELRTIAEGKSDFFSQRNGERMRVPEMSAGCCPDSNVAEYHHPVLDEKCADADFSILTIGRLDKSSTMAAVRGVREFARRRPELKINFLLVGGSNSAARVAEVSRYMEGIGNLHYVNPGYIYPLPAGIFRNVDVALGSAASIALCYNQGVDSIVVDTDDGMGIGFLGETTHSLLRRGPNEPPLSLSEILLQMSHTVSERRRERRAKSNEKIRFPDFIPHLKWIEDVRNNPHGSSESDMTRLPHEMESDLEIALNLMKMPPCGWKEKIFRIFIAGGAEKILYLLKKVKQKKLNVRK